MNWDDVFTNENYRNVKAVDVVNYATELHPEYLDELKQAVDDGKSFTVIKREFYKKYFPDAAPKEKEPTLRELLNMPKKKASKKKK